MIIVKLNGGLGNQLFQYALGKNLANLNKTTLKLDINRYQQKNSLRQYKLNKFNITENLATDNEIKKAKRFCRIPFLSKYKKEKSRNFDNSILSTKNNFYLEGYWQSEKYFSRIGKTIGEEFTLKNPPSENFDKLNKKILITKKNSVTLHIRRGDYSKNPKENRSHTVLQSEYYKKALKIVNEKVANPFYFIFSDDINWCKQHFTTLKNACFIYENLPDYEALIAMSKCQHQIIANSSFSWWGAWLNSNQNKIVIAPAQWYNNLTVNMNDRLPKNWIKINF